MNLNLSNYVLLSNKTNLIVNDHLLNVFIDEWITLMNYSAYFHNCNPSSCTYTRTDAIDISYAVNLFISLYGGLIIILRLISPFCIKILSKFTNKISLWLILISWKIHLQKFSQWIKQLNLFKIADKRTENDIKQQKITTRIYLISLISIIIHIEFIGVLLKISFLFPSIGDCSSSLQFIEYTNSDDKCFKSIINYL